MTLVTGPSPKESSPAAVPTTPNRSVPIKDQKILCVLSYNQCAFPGCNLELVDPPQADQSARNLRGEICHIISRSSRGSRPNTSLTHEQLNHHDNLILLCKNHHHEIDKGNPDKYTPESLRKMKLTHEAAVRRRVIKNSRNIPMDVFSDSQFPTDIIDKRVEEDIQTLYHKSFFNEFDEVPTVANLYNELTVGRLAYASREVRSNAIATLAKMFEKRKLHERAIEAINYATTLAQNHTSFLARTFIEATQSTKSSSLQTLNTSATPDSRTTALLLISKVDGCDAALDWYTNSGLQTADLDPEGQLVLCAMQLKGSRWSQAIKTASEIVPTAIAAMPALNHTVAMANLVTALPVEYRCHFVDHMPLNVRYYLLLDKPDAMTHRRLAIQYFLAAADTAEQYELPKTEANEERYAIWLQLMDPKTAESGRQLLQQRLQPLSSALPFMQLGVEFEILNDLSAVRQELVRQRALNGGETTYSVAASLSILIRMDDPAKLSAFIETNFDELKQYMEPSSLMNTRLRALSVAGNAPQASTILEQLPDDMLSQTDREAIGALIASESPDTELQALEAQYESSTSIRDLQTIVLYVESNEQWPELCRYGRMLFDEAPTAGVATSLAYAYYGTNQPQLIINLVLEEVSFLSMCPRLRLLYCWALHSTGDFREARMQLKHVPLDLDEQAYRSLRRNLDISTGYWDSLPTYIQQALEQIETRSPRELLDAAELAAGIKSSSAMDLIRAAARKGSDDPEVLLACNSLATRLGHEASDDVSDWFFRAVELSQSDGPVKILSSDELIEYRQNWADTRIHIQRLLSTAEIPIFLAAHRLGRGLLEDTLVQAMRNEDTDEIRHQFPVPAYCPKREAPAFAGLQILGFDATAVLNLAYLGILENTIDAFDEIVISSSMLEWLFDEHTRSAVQQPSRLAHASALVRFSDTNRIDFIQEHVGVPQELIDEVGRDLATLLCAAEHGSPEISVPHFVVHPAPSALDDTDGSQAKTLDRRHSLLTSCSSVVTWLAERGRLLQTEIKGALAFLEVNEEPRTCPVSITPGSHLYLSGLTIMYLQRLRILHKLLGSGVTVHASGDTLDEARWLLSHRQFLESAAGQVDSIRRIIVRGIDSGQIRFARRTMIAESETERLVNHPSIDLESISAGTDAVVCDDRFCNKYSTVRRTPRQVPIMTTLGLLDVLVQRQCLSGEDRDSLRTKLRDAGFIFVPVTADEILRFLRVSRCKDGAVIEAAELRAIRDNLRLVRMHGWFQPACDHWWMDSLFGSVATALPELWNGEVAGSCAKAYSFWLRQQFNVRHYAHFFHGDDALPKMRMYEADFYSEILHTAQQLPPPNLVDFLAWFDEWMLAPLRWIDEASYSMVLERQIAWLEELAGRVIHDYQAGASDERHLDLAHLALSLLDRVPRSVREALLDDSDFVARYQLEDHALMQIHGTTITVYSSSFMHSLRRLFAESGAIPVRTPDSRSCVVQFSNDGLEVPVVCQDDESMALREFLMFSPDSSVRIRCLSEASDHFRLPHSRRDQWRRLLLERIPSAHEFDSIMSDLRDTPARVERSIIESLEEGRLGVEVLAPISPLYYSRLIGSCDTSDTIDDFLHEGLSTVLEQHIDAVASGGLSRCLLVAIHPAVVEEIPLNESVGEALRSIVTQSDRQLDLTSQVAAIELALRMLESIPDVGSAVGSLIEGIVNDDVDSPSSRFAALRHLFIIVDMRLAQSRVFGDTPPFYRRAVAIAQSALVHSVLTRYDVRADSLIQLLQVPQVIFHRIQSLMDMRIEPQWHPRYASPAHFKSSACARIRRALDRTESRIGATRLEELLDADTIAEVRKHPWTSLEFPPSPVRGGLRDAIDTPGDALGAVRTGIFAAQLADTKPQDVIYQSLYSKADCEIRGDVRKVLDRFINIGADDVDCDNFVMQLELLATAVGSTRDLQSADRIHSVLLRLLRDQICHINFGTACDIGIAACSSSSDYGEWQSRVSAWLESLVQLQSDPRNARVLSLIVESLCFLSPALWARCGRLYAALCAVRT